MSRQKVCDWCGYPKGFFDHRACIARPDYHDVEATDAWMFNPKRPTRDGQRTMRVLTPDEADRYEEWRATQRYQNN